MLDDVFDEPPEDQDALMLLLGGQVDTTAPVQPEMQAVLRKKIEALLPPSKPLPAPPKPPKAKAPSMSVTLNGPLGQVPTQQPGAPKLMLDGQPEPPPPAAPPRAGAMNMFSAPYTALSGAAGAVFDQPPEASTSDRVGAAMRGGGNALLNAPFETKSISDEALRRGVDTGATGKVADFALDTLLGGDDPGDIAKAGVGLAGFIPKVAQALPEGIAAAKAAVGALPEGLDAVRAAAGSAYDGAKMLKTLDKETAQAFMAATANFPQVRKAAQSMHPSEVALLTNENTVREFARFYDELPDVKTLVGGAHGGAGKRGWYEHSRNAIEHVYGKDADLFAGVLAATSPQNSVEMNFKNATAMFDNWIGAGRPTDEATIKQLLASSVSGQPLPAWNNNTVRVLQEGKTLSGSKVDSFWTNLRSRARQMPQGEMAPDQAVTLDAWMANLFGVQNESFGGSASANQLVEGNPGLSPRYLAGSARVREAAKSAGIAPAEAQETLWSFGKALYEQAEETGMSARQVIEQDLLSPERISGTPDFSVLFQQQGRSVPSPSVKPWTPDTTMSKKEMLTLADTLDALRDRRQMLTRHKTASPQAGTVMAHWPIEAAPGASGVAPGFMGKTQNQQDSFSNRILSKLTDVAGRNRIGEALFPGQTAPVLGGRGDWTSGGVTQNNKLQTTPIRMRTVKGGSELHPADASAGRLGSDLLSVLLGQDAGVTSAMQTAPVKGRGVDTLRVWPSIKAESFPESGLAALRQQLSPDDYALQHRTEGIDIAKLGSEMTDVEQQQIEQIARQAMFNANPRSAKITPAKTSGARSGVNIADANTQYRTQPWGEVGSRAVTNQLMQGQDWATLSAKRKRDLDVGVRPVAEDLLREYSKDKNTRPDHLNLLSIIAKDGVTGLAKALGDPSQVLPVLAMLGLGGTLGVSKLAQEPEQ